MSKFIKDHKPCRECPFKRSAVRGYLGECSWRPEEFLFQLNGMEPLPCHLTVDWETEEHDLNGACYCTGALQYMRNSCKMPINAEWNNAVQSLDTDIENIFNWPHEFIEHHKRQA